MAKNNFTVAERLAHFQSRRFGGRLAYVVVDRAPHRSHNNSDATTMFYFHALGMLASGVASTLGFSPSNTSVVLRTRPDILFTTYFNLTGALLYFKHGLHVRRMIFSQEATSQGDINSFMSFGAYLAAASFTRVLGRYHPTGRPRGTDHIAIGDLNFWGYGYSLGCGPRCVTEADTDCGFTIVESFSTHTLLRSPPADIPPVNGPPYDLTAAVITYCPPQFPPVNYTPAVARKFYICEGYFYYRKHPIMLVSPAGAVQPFDEGCSTQEQPIIHGRLLV